MPKLLVTFFILVSCGDDSVDPDEESNELTIVTNSANNEEVQLTVEPNSTLRIPAGKRKYTEAIYADVDPSDNLKIVFLVDDSKEMAEHHKKLAPIIDSLLMDIINSNWRIAVTTLGSQIFPKDLPGGIKNPANNANAPNYEKAFENAINNLREASADNKSNNGLTVFVIVTNNDLDQTTSLNKLLTNSQDKLVFALLDLEDQHQGSNNYLEWRDLNDKAIIDRYGSINREDYRKMFEEFSQHTADFLKRNFYLKGYYGEYSWQGRPTGHRAYQGGDLSMRVTVDPVTNLNGQIPATGFSLNNRRILTNAKLPDGMCVEIDYPVEDR